MIEVKNVSQTFQTARGPFQALADVSLSIPKGDFVAIIGRSGAGKSTFLRTLNGLLIPSQGQVVIAGTDITKLPKRELQKYRRSVGFICPPESESTRAVSLALKSTRAICWRAIW